MHEIRKLDADMLMLSRRGVHEKWKKFRDAVASGDVEKANVGLNSITIEIVKESRDLFWVGKNKNMILFPFGGGCFFLRVPPQT